MGPGSVPKEQGAIRLTLNVLWGVEFEGGHREDHGVSPSGQVIDVPLYRHEVSLDFVRTELGVEYTFLDGWDVWLRIPYEVKAQRVSFRQVEPATFDQIVAQKRHTDLHHRTETYTGLSDLMLLVARRWSDLLFGGDSLTVAAGFTVPTGQTERDPFEAGDQGEEHLHIQFGTGTVDPLLELYYQVPLPADMSLSVSATGRFPFYENPKTYRGPVEVTGNIRLGYAVTEWLAITADFTTFWQSFAYWDGHRDENSGLVSLLGAVGFTVRPCGGFSINLGARYPLYQRTLSAEGDTFEQGPSFLFSVSWLLP